MMLYRVGVDHHFVTNNAESSKLRGYGSNVGERSCVESHPLSLVIEAALGE